MAGKVAIGYQEFEDIREKQLFYIDKTSFIKEWWENNDRVTLITRPRRFGKTLTMSMVENFFSIKNAQSGGLFEGLAIWEEEKYRQLQGSYPVIFLSFANVKETSFVDTKQRIGRILTDLYNRNSFLLQANFLTESDRQFFQSINPNMDDTVATIAIQKLSEFLFQYYGKKVIILLDEYDTPMQEAYVSGYWNDLSHFIRNLFNATFKGNSYLERAIMTGITRISKESIFSDLNNLKVVTTTSDEYADCFGFTEEEVFAALDEYGLEDRKEEVKRWYDGFVFGQKRDIYNPWSIINYLDQKKVGLYWTNTSSNRLVGELIQKGTRQLKESFEELLTGGTIVTELEEQMVYNQLDIDESAIWSLLVASGYLRVKNSRIEGYEYEEWRQIYELQITNFEVKIMFRHLVRGWFAMTASNYNDFIKALLLDDVKAMNVYMNRVALATFSFFDSGNRASAESEPERFYHGFVLGLMVELSDRYSITSNRESGFGRYDVLLEPKNPNAPAMILEFKVQDSDEEKELSDTVAAALRQIEEKQYATALVSKGIPESNIRRYGFAFRGKKVLIGRG